jgi:anti-sigma B factor antagonist
VDVTVIEDALRGCTVVKIRGELDIASVPGLRDELLIILDREPLSLMILDLSELEFIDSSGTAVLVHTQRRARLLGCTLALVAPQPAVSRVLQICGLDHYFLIFENVSAAVGRAQTALPGSSAVSGHDTGSE